MTLTTAEFYGLEPTCVIFDEVWNQTKVELYVGLIEDASALSSDELLQRIAAQHDRVAELVDHPTAGERGSGGR